MADINKISNGWEHTRDIIKKGHNRDLNRFFLDVKELDSNARAHVKKALRINSTDSALEVLNKQIHFRLGLGAADEKLKSVTSFPEHWEVTPGDDRPQLAIVYREAGKSGAGNSTLYIPHYDGSKNPIFPSYTKGNIMGILKLKDNSRIVVNAFSEIEVKKVINNLKKYVKATYLTNNLKITKRQSEDIKSAEYKPLRADYYPKGRKNSVPEWQHYF